MKIKLFEPNILPVSIKGGIIGSILLIVILSANFLCVKLDIKVSAPLGMFLAMIGISSYPLAMLGVLIIYKRKENSGMNYLKSFVIAFLVFNIVCIIAFSCATIMSYMEDGHVTPISFAFIIFLRLLIIGIASSLVAALFFTNKTIHKVIAIGIIVIAIIAIIVLKRYQII